MVFRASPKGWGWVGSSDGYGGWWHWSIFP